MSLISVDHVDKLFGSVQALEDVSFRLDRGEHVALVGSNGAGKSTLLRLIAGQEEPDAGSVTRARGTRVVYLPQEPDFDTDATLYEALLDTFRSTIEAEDRMRGLQGEMAAGRQDAALVEEYDRLQALVEHTGYDYRQRVEQVLTGLELGQETWHLPVGELSGGQRTRAGLARTLLQEADVLLLDEPTNHLDIPALQWLEGYLRELRAPFLIVAHDRYLLDRVTRRTLELSFGHVTDYDAPYSKYLEIKAERMERRRAEYEAQQEQVARTEEFIRRYGAGQRSREARGRQRGLDRLERVQRPEEEESLHLRLGKPSRSGDIVLEARGLVVGYTGHPLIRLPREVALQRGDKVALIGPNGSGKTTLLRTLIGALPPLEGSARWGANAAIGYYSQTLEGLDEHRTVLDEILRAAAMGEEDARGYLGRFLFEGDDVSKPVGTLSGGEKSRVALARLLLEDHNVLVLDEPTNHLDIASRDALRDVLQTFAGTLLFVSHDRYLIDALAHQIWAVEGGELRRYAGNHSAYADSTATPLDAPEVQVKRPPAAEASLQSLQEEAASLAARLAEAGPTVSLQHLAEMMDRYAEVQAQLEKAQARWLEQIRAQLHASSV